MESPWLNTDAAAEYLSVSPGVVSRSWWKFEGGVISG